MIKALLWILVGILLYHYGVVSSVVNYFVTSDVIDLIIEFLEGLRTSEEQ
jgi:hypothetical protein|tara:strand:+ start:360 stop:509 length:150 start_codon:yes stop_codon:yes gene_type:complete